MGRKTVRNQITSPEKTAQINKSNMRLLDDYINYMRSIKRSEGTCEGYRSDLLIIFTYMLEYLGNKNFQDLTKRDIISMQNWMLSIGWSSSRIRRVKAAISSLSNFIENILDDDPEFQGFRSIVRKIESPPLQAVREKTVLSDEDVEKIFAHLKERGQTERACFVALGLYGGRRKSEMLRFRVSDFDDDHIVCDGALYKSDPILTKGAKQLECYTLAKKFKPYLDAWLSERAEIGIVSEWLFPDRDNPSEHRSTSTIDGWFNTISNATGINLYPHSLRHKYITSLSEAGIPDNVIIQIIGWAASSGSEMFSIYNDSPKDNQIAAYFKDGDIFIPEEKSLQEI